MGSGLQRYSILIANRGEIAIRIARSIRELGWIPLGIYTNVDKKSLHRKYMVLDYQVSSYLDIDDIIKAAQELGADAIHPGYGFLSENPEFARRVKKAGLVFIGPSPESMELAGDKVQAKIVAEKAGIPTLPWMIVKDPSDIIEFAKEHGYPVLLKAVSGGGGMGIRLIRSDEEAEKLFEQATKEAENAFGDGRLYVEKFLDNPKHIEVQILSDGDNIIHLYERDCSVQRRHQKLIEEAPAIVLNNKEREQITSDAVKLMKYLGYVNAGTVEMLFDLKTRKHYFMEINARLQVEHPVTEMITGVDIVKQQLLIALENNLPLRQRDVVMHGHAIEVRINAENPISMMPSPGTIEEYIEPNGPGIRVDSGVTKGSVVPSEYNPLIAKLIAWAPSREEAIKRMIRALTEYTITGIETNILLLRNILEHDVFLKALHTTKFLDNHINDIISKIREWEIIQAIAISVVTLRSVNGFRSMIPAKSLKLKDKHRLLRFKRQAWFYWSALKSRVRRPRVRKPKIRKK